MMGLFDLAEARQVAMAFLAANPAPDGFSFAILDEYTIERPKFFVFFYESSRFLNTGNFEDRLVGNGPVLVNKTTGSVLQLGTALPVESYISDYEATL